MTAQDPAVRTWQDATEAAMAQSTSALGRLLQKQLDALRTEYNAVALERDALAARVAELEQEQARARHLAAEYRAGGM